VTGLYSLGGASDGNYQLASTAFSGSASITQRPITVSANAESKDEGSADPQLTYQVTSGGFLGGDGLTGALSRTLGETVGAYAITQGTLAASANYDLTYVGAYLTILATGGTVTSDAGNYPTRQFVGPAVSDSAAVVNISYQTASGGAVSIGVVRNANVGAGASAANGGSSGSGNSTAAGAANAKVAAKQDSSQNIEPASGRTSLFWPISQFDKSQYTPGALPAYAPQAGQAAVLAMIARAEANNRQTPKIDLLWREGRPDWTDLQVASAKSVKFADDKGAARTPLGDNGFALVNGTTDILELLKRGPIMLGAGEPIELAKATDAAKSSDPGKPSDPSKAADPAKPSDPTASASAGKSSDPAKPSDGAASTDAAKLTEPAKPTDPVKPTDVVKPSEPAKPADVAKSTEWLLALEARPDGKSLLANDPITGRQVVLAFDPATRKIGGVIGVIDPRTKKLAPLGDAPPDLGNPSIVIPPAAWSQLKSFRPASYFAVTL
jgi:hypothetical protein